MIYIISAVAVIIPLFIFLFLIRRIDRYKNDSSRVIILNFAWGAAGAIVLILLFGFFINKLFFLLSPDVNTEQLESIVIAPLLEESVKALILIVILTRRKTDYITDGMIFGGAIGLGFSTVENFLYFITYGSTLNDWLYLVIVRTLFSAVMHCVAAAIFGAFFVFSRYKGGISAVIYPVTGFILAVILHSTWNISVNYDSAFLAGLLSMIIIVSVFVLVFIFSINNEKKIIYTELADEVERGTIPPEHLIILVSPVRHNKGWIDENVRPSYIKSAANLAFRKMQFKYSSGKNKDYCQQDIEHFRNLISELLKSNSIPNE